MKTFNYKGGTISLEFKIPELIHHATLLGAYQPTRAEQEEQKRRQHEADRIGFLQDLRELEWMNRRLTGNY
jgi:hypothetical protein